MITLEYALEVKEYLDEIYDKLGWEAHLKEAEKFHKFIEIGWYDDEEYECYEAYQIMMETLYGEDFFNCF